MDLHFALTTKSPSPTGPLTEYIGSAAGGNGSRISGLTSGFSFLFESAVARR